MTTLVPVLNYDRVTLALGGDVNQCICQGVSDSNNYLFLGNTNPIVFTIISNQPNSTQFENLTLSSVMTNPATSDTFNLNMNSRYGGNKPYQISTDTNDKCNNYNIPKLKSPVTDPKSGSFADAQWFVTGTNTTPTDTNIYYGKPYMLSSVRYSTCTPTPCSTPQVFMIQNTSLQTTCKSGAKIVVLSPSSSNTTPPAQTAANTFYFLNYNQDVPTRPTSILCCTQDPNIGSNAATYCGTNYWGSTGVCDNVVSTYCKSNPSDNICSCVNSPVPQAHCFDAKCSNNPAAYIPSNTDKNCAGGCITLINTVNSGGGTVKQNLSKANFCEYCSSTAGASTTGINCPSKSHSDDIYWIIGGCILGIIILIIILALIVYLLKPKKKSPPT